MLVLKRQCPIVCNNTTKKECLNLKMTTHEYNTVAMLPILIT